MCAEAVWWRCHRRIIADYLLATGETVFHITAPKMITLAQLMASAQRSSQFGPAQLILCGLQQHGSTVHMPPAFALAADLDALQDLSL
jgi:hypothetical protein